MSSWQSWALQPFLNTGQAGPDAKYRIESRKNLLRAKFYNIALASILTTLIAGSFSSIPAAYHFGRLAPYGVLANGLAVPVVSLVVMPFAVLSVVLMPLGLEGWPLAALGKGLEMVISISDGVAELPGAQRVIPQLPLASAIIGRRSVDFMPVQPAGKICRLRSSVLWTCYGQSTHFPTF